MQNNKIKVARSYCYLIAVRPSDQEHSDKPLSGAGYLSRRPGPVGRAFSSLRLTAKYIVKNGANLLEIYFLYMFFALSSGSVSLLYML